jgi:hypothetical protein
MKKKKVDSETELVIGLAKLIGQALGVPQACVIQLDANPHLRAYVVQIDIAKPQTKIRRKKEESGKCDKRSPK